VQATETTVTLTDLEKRILRAALREFAATLQSDFGTLREYHTFLRDDDEQVDLSGLAVKLGLESQSD
jgi:hypothetical protein